MTGEIKHFRCKVGHLQIAKIDGINRYEFHVGKIPSKSLFGTGFIFHGALEGRQAITTKALNALGFILTGSPNAASYVYNIRSGAVQFFEQAYKYKSYYAF